MIFYTLLEDELLAQGILWWECLSCVPPGSKFSQEEAGHWQFMGPCCHAVSSAGRMSDVAHLELEEEEVEILQKAPDIRLEQIRILFLKFTFSTV